MVPPKYLCRLQITTTVAFNDDGQLQAPTPVNSTFSGKCVTLRVRLAPNKVF